MGVQSTSSQTSFENLDFGTVVTTSEYQKVEVLVDPEFMMQDYAEAIVHDLQRRNPGRFKAVEEQISEDRVINPDGAEVTYDMLSLMKVYVTDLARIRLQAIEGNCKIWNTAKEFAIPPYIQFALSQIGTIIDLDNGRKLVPCIESPDLILNEKQLLRATEYLRTFSDDGITLLYDAFPRSKEGDKETMAYAIIADYIKSQYKNSNPAKSYVAAFLGMKIKQENEFKCLYSVRYDNVEFVRDRLIHALTDRW